MRYGSRIVGGLALVVALAACAEESSPGAIDTIAAPASLQLIDSTLQPAIGGADGWNYQQRAAADFDGDGVTEQVVLTARVELYRGRPAWDDGQPWQVYVEEADTTRTYVFARYVQLGTVTMRVGEAVDGKRSSVILLVHLPDHLGVYEVGYEGPGRASVAQRFERVLDPRGDLASPRLP